MKILLITLIFENSINGGILFLLSTLFLISFFKDFINKHRCLFTKTKGGWKFIWEKICTYQFVVTTCIVLIALLIFRIQSKFWLMASLGDLGISDPAISFFIIAILLCHPLSYMANILHKIIYYYISPYTVEKYSHEKVKNCLSKEDFYLFNTNVVNNVNLLRIFIIFIFAFAIWDHSSLLTLLASIVMGYLSTGFPPVICHVMPPEVANLPEYETYGPEYLKKWIPKNGPLSEYWMDRAHLYCMNVFANDEVTFEHIYAYAYVKFNITAFVLEPEMANPRSPMVRDFKELLKPYWERFIHTIQVNDLSYKAPKIITLHNSSSLTYVDKHIDVLVVHSVNGGADNTVHIDYVRSKILRSTQHEWAREKRLLGLNRAVFSEADATSHRGVDYGF